MSLGCDAASEMDPLSSRRPPPPRQTRTDLQVLWLAVRNDSVFQNSPVLRLDPAGQNLPDVHGEVVVVQIVHMFQESVLQLLDLLPLAHAAQNPKKPLRTAHPSDNSHEFHFFCL